MEQQQIAIARTEGIEYPPDTGDPFVPEQRVIGRSRGIVRLLPPRAGRESLTANARSLVIDRQPAGDREEPRSRIAGLLAEESHERLLHDIFGVVGALYTLPD
jgi:hypothetical protein